MKIDKIMFIQPTRGRPAFAMEGMDSILSTMRSGMAYSYFLAVDNDDQCLGEYPALAAQKHFTIVANDNPHEVVEATNHAAKMIADEDLIFIQTDDYRWNEGWDVPFIEFAKSLPDMAFIYDPAYNERLGIPQILSRALYERLGYVYWPEYISMYADNDCLEVAEKLGCAYQMPPALWTHLHPHFRARPMDATTARTNENHKYEHGKRVLEKRRLEGFNL